MFKISIVPDTNVMLSNLETVKAVYAKENGVSFTLNFPKTVLTELEILKATKNEARNAIRFMESISNSLKTEIQGMVDDRKIDVVIPSRNHINPTNNDDKILNYCFELENPILLTNDKAFYLKCRSHNIKALVVGDMNSTELFDAILADFGVIATDQIKAANIEYVEKVRNILKITLQPTIHLIMERELGGTCNTAIDKNSSLDRYLEFVIKNFYLFRNFLPSKAPEIIKQFLQALKEQNVTTIKQLVHPMCMIFRKAAPKSLV